MLILPFPPSNNTYYRHVGSRILLSKAGRDYRKAVADAVLIQRPMSFVASYRLALTVTACPPDRRRRDLDNMLKAVCDALKFAGVYADDSQIDTIQIGRGDVKPGGCLYVAVVSHGTGGGQ